MFEQVIEFLNKERNTFFVLSSDNIYTGEVDVGGEKINLNIDLGQGFPHTFPTISITESKRFIPHTFSGGRLCLFDEASVMIKQNLPEQILLDSFDRAIEILEMNPEKQNEEVFREFFAYWGAHSQMGIILYTNLPPASSHELQEYAAIGSKINQLVVSESLEESRTILINHMSCTAESVETYRIPCYRIRLRTSALPKMYEKFTWKAIRSFILENLTGSQKRRFNQMLSEKVNSVNRMLLLTIPSIYGDQNACLWLHRGGQKRNHALRNVSDCVIDAVSTYRIDPQYMIVRGGAESIIRDKSVLLIGCGSVGGFLAENLCQCGIGALDILDKDKLSIDNVHRHVLGFDDAVTGLYKTDLLKKELESRFPYVDIDSLSFVDRTAETFIKDPKRLACYDLIISATGNPTIDLEINEVLYKLDSAPPFVVCFNEPYGIGGHAIAVLKKGACLRCLYSDSISGELSNFQGSFVKKDQPFLKTISGCSSAFIEYSVLDSQQTAIIATRLIIDVLKDKCNHTRLVSWVGSSEKLRGEGFQPSEYYEELERDKKALVFRDIPSVERCHTCGKYY